MKHLDPRFLDLETKSEGDADPVTAALAEFRTSLDARLSGFETKHATRLDGLEARLNRPAAGLETKAASLEDRAFATYLRRGPDAMGELERKALSAGSMGDGGFLANPQFGAELLRLIVQYSPIRSYASKITVNAASITWPRKIGSVAAQWVNEGMAPAESGPKFEQMKINVATLMADSPVTMQLLEDNDYGLEAVLLNDFAEQFGKAEGAAFINGTGVGQPVGLLTSPDPRIKLMSTGDANGLGADPASLIIKAFHELPGIVAGNGTWILNRNSLGALRGLKDSIGRPLFLESLITGTPSTILGRPVAEMVDMPDIAAGACPIMFGDLSGYMITDRIQPSVYRDPYTLLRQASVNFVGRKRVGGDIVNPDRFLKIVVGA